MEFLPDRGHAVPIESGETMSRRPRRNHTPGFKAKVALAAIKGDRTLAQALSDKPERAREGCWSEAFRPPVDATRPGRQNGSA